MDKIQVTASFSMPNVEFDERDQKYFEELVAEVLEKKGAIGLLIALELYLEK